MSGNNLWDEPVSVPMMGPVFTATYESEDACCGDGIMPGEDIRGYRGGWIHADDQCEKLATGTLTERDLQIKACGRCFTTHAPGQGIECY